MSGGRVVSVVRSRIAPVASARHAASRGVAVRIVLLTLLVLVCGVVDAQTRAWLDRDRIAMGETTTLNVETDMGAAPDYAPLLRDFDLGGQASQQRVQWTNGAASARALYAVALRPRRDGLLQIPALRVGGASTSPLTLLVTPAAANAPTAGGDVFLESEADTQSPYVQQSVGWVVRLYSAIPLIAGNLEQDEPPGASLQRVGDDVQYRRTIGGRSYVVTERRYLLVPERSGELVVPPARFDGRGTGDVFDRLFGDGQNALHAVARPRILRVQPIPADAPQPWLPLRGLALRYIERPQRAKAGVAADVVVGLDADGAGASQLPSLDLPAVDGVQVFAERAQSDESMVDGRPQVRLQRRFQIVPTRAGRLEVPGPRIDWWDSRAGVARTTQLPPIVLDVAPGAVAAVGAAARVGESGGARATPAGRDMPRMWLAIAVVVAMAVIAGVVLWRRRRVAAAAPRGPVGVDATARVDAAVPPPAWNPPSVLSPAAPPPSVATPPDAGRTTHVDVPPAAPPPVTRLPRLLELGDLAELDAALRTLAGADDLDGVIARLDDPTQRDAVERLRRARWAGGDPADARAHLRKAFLSGPRWHATPQPERSTLPPLYPER